MYYVANYQWKLQALRLSKASQGNATVGKLVNLLSNDTSRFDINMNFIPFLAAGPVQFIIFSYFLYDGKYINIFIPSWQLWVLCIYEYLHTTIFTVIGPACFAGIGFIVLLLPMMCMYILILCIIIFSMQFKKHNNT